MNFVYCRVKLKGCLGVAHIDDTERWREVSGSDGVCPNCITASKPKPKEAAKQQPQKTVQKTVQPSLFDWSDNESV